MDRRTVGLALVSLILSTLIVVTIAREKVEQPIEIFKNEFPATLKRIAGTESTLSFAVVARERFENLQIRYSMMWPVALQYNEMVDPNRKFDASSTAEDVLGNSLMLSWLRNETALLGIEPEKYDVTVDLEGHPNRILIEDYSNIIDSLSGTEAIIGSPLTYAAIVDENGEAYYLEGTSGFFFDPESNILSLRISRNDEGLEYYPESQIWEGSNRIPLSEVPKGGILDYSNVEKDDRFNVILSVEPRVVPEGFGYTLGANRKNIGAIQMIRVYLDGELYDEPIINLMKA